MGRVLIFDDDEDILELCTIILRQKGLETVGETSSKHVIERISETGPDVILMDNWIPGIGGVEATQLIKSTKATRHIPVILFSANNDIEKIASEAKADYYLKKPFDISALSEMIGRVMNNGIKANPH